MPSEESAHPSPRLRLEPDGLARVVFDDPDRSANVLTESVMYRLSSILAEIRAAHDAGTVDGVIFLSGKPSSYIVGADVDAIEEIQSPEEGAEAVRRGQAIFLELERLPVPTLAAIHGTCMGGGTELGLACRYRVASRAASTKIGLPEVQLGILPAWGGTSRLPRLVGLQAALDLLLTGDSVSAEKAERIGLVDDLLPEPQFERFAVEFLRERIAENGATTGAHRGFMTRLLDDTAPGRRIVLRTAKGRVLSKTGGHYPAPLRILDVVRSSFGAEIEDALELEARAAGELIASRISKNLIHVFQLRQDARKGPGIDAEAKKVSQVGVAGAGTMGGGIAQLMAYHGLRVRLKDVRREPIAEAFSHARGLFDKAVSKRIMSRRDADQAMERVSGGLDYDGFAPLDLVIEAVVEKPDVKRTVLRELEARVSPTCVLATNTSSLSVDDLADGMDRPERFLGMHFFNPVHKMPLIEVVRGARTDDAAVATVCRLAIRLGKIPVVVRDGPGFLVNRILGPYLNEAGFLLAEGASVEAVDRAAEEFGMPMGPLRLIDEVGIDVMRHAGDSLHEAFGERMSPAPPLVALGASDRLGRKGGSGFYRYEDGDEAEVDESSYEMVLDGPDDERTPPLMGEIRDRLILAMINEAARALSEGIASSAGDVDLALVMGTGFPPFRGGLLRFADEVHPRVLVERLERYEDTIGARFAPAPILCDLARDDSGFYEAFPG